MPWTLSDLDTDGGGLVRTTIFSDTNHNLNNLNGTMLVAKLNSYHLGIFVSGKMKEEYASVNGHDDPHAEDNLTQALRDILPELERQGYVFGDRVNILSIKLSKSPCSRCASTLVAFQNLVCTPKNIRIRIKLMKLYEGEGTDKAARSIGELTAAGVVCVPWRIEDRYQEKEDGTWELRRAETKLGLPHELSRQSMSSDEIRRMSDRTAELARLAPVSSTVEYKGLKKPPSAESIRTEIKNLNDRIGQCEINIQNETKNKRALKSTLGQYETKLKTLIEKLDGRRPTPGSHVADTIKRLRHTSIPKVQEQIDSADQRIMATKTQRLFLENRVRELEASLKHRAAA